MKMMPDIRSRFEDPRNFDLLVPLVIQHWEAFYGTVAEFVPHGAEEVLELGSGTGVLSSFILKVHPSVHLTCIERNPEVLAIAREKPDLAGTVWIEADIRKAWPERPYDAIVSTQCLFQLSPDDREEIARRAHGVLTDGGRFLNGDLFHPGTARELDLSIDAWCRFMQNSGLTEQESRAMIGPLERMIQGYTIEAWSALLTSVGFARVAIPYRSGLYAIVAGFRDPAVESQ
jgi:tRNA (cmo5U34)-methyltransferase